MGVGKWGERVRLSAAAAALGEMWDCSNASTWWERRTGGNKGREKERERERPFQCFFARTSSPRWCFVILVIYFLSSAEVRTHTSWPCFFLCDCKVGISVIDLDKCTHTRQSRNAHMHMLEAGNYFGWIERIKNNIILPNIISHCCMAVCVCVSLCVCVGGVGVYLYIFCAFHVSSPSSSQALS